MRIGKTIRPGRPGTARWVSRYGDRLIAVRYRYDPARALRYTTVELVAEACPWTKGVNFPKGMATDDLAPETVYVRVSFQESELRERVKAAGGRWDKERKAWELRFERVVRLGLKHRIQFLTDPPA